MCARRRNWGEPRGPNRGRGIAVNEEASAFYAVAVEVTLDAKGWLAVDRVVVAGDPGFLLHPDNANAQVEGSVAFALSAALYGEITLSGGRVRESNFHDYGVLRLHEMPIVDTIWGAQSAILGRCGRARRSSCHTCRTQRHLRCWRPADSISADKEREVGYAQCRPGRAKMTSLTVNGSRVTVRASGDTPLLWVLRNELSLTGTKFGCGGGHCGACTVHVSGQAVYSCLMPIAMLAGKAVTTIEGLSPDGRHPLQLAWIEEQVPQCGYCQSGQIMRAGRRRSPRRNCQAANRS